MKFPLLIALLVGALVAGVAWRLDGRHSEDSARGGERALAVKTVPVAVLDFPRVLDLPGTLEAETLVAVTAQVGGVLLRQRVQEGDTVKAGQVLFELDAAPATARVAQADASLTAAEAALRDATRRLERLTPLVEPGYISQQELDDARLAEDAARAQRDAARAARAGARLDAGYAAIRAPVSGRVGRISVQPGALVLAAGTPLTTVVAAGDLLVRASVAEQDWPLLAAARTAGRISAEVRDKHATEGLARGELVFIDNQIDPASGAVAIKVRLIDPPPSLLSGQALPLRLTLGVEPGARAVPDAAVQVGQNGSFVYVVRDGKAVAQAVQALRSLDGMTQIAGDVRAGEAVLVEIPKRLRDGSLVKLARVAGDAGKSGARSGGKPSPAP